MKTIDNDIKAGDFKKVYLLYGQERYLIKQYRDKLIKAMVSEGDSMNFSSFEGDGINQKEIIDLAETLPFFADKRVILIEDAGIFSKAGDELGEYLKDSPESTHFIFVEESVDKRSKLYKAAAKCGNPVEFKEQTDETLARWIGMRIRKDGKGMSQAAYNSFIEKTGTDMENIDKVLEKLLCYCMDKDVIELSDVEAVTTEQITNKVFEMVDAIASHKQKRALELYYDLLALKEPAMRIMYLISRQFNILMNVKAMTNKGFGNKKPGNFWLPEAAYHKYPAFVRALRSRYYFYNKTVEWIDRLEQEGKIFVIRPSVALPIGRTEHSVEKLQETYDIGRKDAANQMHAMENWFKSY